jgi:hypothetical protein
VKALALAIAVLLAACARERPSPGNQRGPRPTASIDTSQGAASPAQPAPASGTRSPRSERRRRSEPEAPRNAAPEATEEPSAEPSSAPELPAALARAFGTPTICISPATRARLEGRLTVHVQVNVTPSGIVTRANVTSSQLAREDLECMRVHAERLRLPGPIPNAPRSVSTAVEYDVSSARVEPADDEPRYDAVPRSSGSVAPDRTLPMAGTETSRPRGSVAPDRTLPVAGTEASRPPGFVPPSHTLPAQVD